MWMTAARRAKRKLRDACARAAKLLANGAAQADVEADALVDGMDARARVTRARFEDLSSDVVAKAQSLVAAVSTGSSPLLIFAGAGRAVRAAARGSCGGGAEL